MAAANPIGAYIQGIIGGPVQQMRDYGEWLYTEVNDGIKWLDHNIEELVKEKFPESTHQVAMSVIRALPETGICAAVFSGYGVTPALLYWGVRVAKISWPFIKEFMSLDFDQERVGRAAGSSLKELFDSYKSFRPAIGVCAACAAAVAFVFGWVTGDYSMMIRSTIYGVVAQLAFQAVVHDLQVQAAGDGGHPPSPPGGAGSAKSDSLNTTASAAPSSASSSSAVLSVSGSSSSGATLTTAAVTAPA